LPDVFSQIKSLKTLEKLDLNVTTKDSFIKLLNQNLNKESCLKHVEINFVTPREQSEPKNIELKFPRYMKHLVSLKLQNIFDKNFTETMFDMASQSRLQHLWLSLLSDQ
jgi:hypothetical protein